MPGDLDSVVGDIVPIILEHLLGDVAHQKDIDAIKRKTREARQKTLPYHAYQILARGISFSNLPQLIEPLKKQLEETYSLADVKKISDVLRHVAMGLAVNNTANPRDTLIYIYSLLSKYLEPSHTKQVKKPEKEESLAERESRRKKEEEESKYLIAELPTPGGKFKRTRKEKEANMNVLAEFGLEMLLSLLRKRTSATAGPPIHEANEAFMQVFLLQTTRNTSLC